jgi:hypothetical protein
MIPNRNQLVAQASRLRQRRLKPAATIIAFAKSFFHLSPLPPAGGEGYGEGGEEKTFGNDYNGMLNATRHENFNNLGKIILCT